jgi:hypothetical protein
MVKLIPGESSRRLIHEDWGEDPSPRTRNRIRGTGIHLPCYVMIPANSNFTVNDNACNHIAIRASPSPWFPLSHRDEQEPVPRKRRLRFR